MSETCSEIIVKTSERRRQWRLSGPYIVKFEYISQIVVMFPLLTLNKKMPSELFTLITL